MGCGQNLLGLNFLLMLKKGGLGLSYQLLQMRFLKAVESKIQKMESDSITVWFSSLPSCEYAFISLTWDSWIYIFDLS